MASQRLPYFHIVSALLFVASMIFFWYCMGYLAKRDYVAAGLLLIIGVCTLRAGSELARLALAERDG